MEDETRRQEWNCKRKGVKNWSTKVGTRIVSKTGTGANEHVGKYSSKKVTAFRKGMSAGVHGW